MGKIRRRERLQGKVKTNRPARRSAWPRSRFAGRSPSRYHETDLPGEGRALLDEKRGIYAGDFLYLLRTVQRPMVLVEAGFLASSAEEAGLKAWDVIVSINGQPTATVPELQEQVALYRPGDRVSLEFFRDGQRLRRDNVILKGLNSTASSY